MTVSSFINTNFLTMDPTTYKAAIDGDNAVLGNIASDYSPSGSTGMFINVAGGNVYFRAGATLTVSSAQVSATISATSASSVSRIDRAAISLNTSSTPGLLSIITGTPSTAPAVPALSSLVMPCCQILVNNSQTLILNNQITDERTMFVL